MNEREIPTHGHKPFVSLGKEPELSMLNTDDSEFTQTKTYLMALITDSLSHFELTPEQRKTLEADLLGDVKIAATRYLASETSMAGDYPFCTYFTWYIGERVNAVPGLKRQPEE